MPAFEEHARDCERILGQRCESVNHWIDEGARRFGVLHRFWRHHEPGVEEAGIIYGPWGALAALVHILKDCGHIPTAAMWRDQEVDSLGMIPTGRFNGYWDPQQFDAAARKVLHEYGESKDIVVHVDGKRLRVPDLLHGREGRSASERQAERSPLYTPGLWRSR